MDHVSLNSKPSISFAIPSLYFGSLTAPWKN